VLVHGRSVHPAAVALPATVALVAVAAVVLLPGVAEAHVAVAADSDVVGTDATLTFRVPTESASASTVQIVVTLPTDPPLLSVTPQVHPGWTVRVTQAPLPTPVVVEGTTITRAPHLVIWTAQPGQAVPPEQFATFGLLVEDLPDADQLTFPTAQHYSDGTVVEWTDPFPAGSAEPAHPVPTLHLVKQTTASSATTASGTGDDRTPTWLAVAALVVALVALGLAVGARRSVRSATP
jgi:periplasmic copper chaperone A